MFGRQFALAEDAQRTRFHLCGPHEQAHRAGAANQVEIEQPFDDRAQRIDIERIELIRREETGQSEQEFRGRRNQAGGRRWLAGQRGLHRVRRRSDRGPERFELLPCALGAAFGQPVCQRERVHRAGAGTADGLVAQVRYLEQAIQHAPGECTQGAAALQGEVDGVLTQGGADRSADAGLGVRANSG